MTEARVIDWERIEGDYRAGVMSLREIARANKVTDTAIRKRAKRDAWERDLNAKIMARADALVRKEAVRTEVRSSRTVSDKDIIEANAERIAQVRGEHRSDITRFRSLAIGLLTELEAETGDIESFRTLGEWLRSEDDRGTDKRNDIYQRVISSAGRVDTTKKLAETLKVLIGLEREAYGIDAGGKPDKPSDSPESKYTLSEDDLIAIAASRRE